MTEFHFAFRTLGQFVAHLLNSDLSLQTLLTVYMLAWQPFRVLYIYRLANGTLEFSIHQLEEVR